MVYYIVLLLLSLSAWVNAQCNPLTSSCSPIPGLAKTSYEIDFTKQASLPSDWILADQANVTYGANGADFSFRKRKDAPYIWTNFYVLFGRIEVVLQAAPEAGIITGAVMMSDDLDEIDWEFSGNNFGSSTGKVQTNYFGKGITGNYDRGTQPPVESPNSQFHTYVLDWTPNTLTWSIDGTNVHQIVNRGDTSGSHQYPQTPSRLHMGVWCAGDPDSYPATVAWGGGYSNFSAAPFTAYVKSVKITTPNPCSAWQYPTKFSGKWQEVVCTNSTLTTTTLIAATSSVLPTPSNLPCNYIVATGDYGYAIASKLGIAFDDLKQANPMVDWDKLLIGQNLVVPGGRCTSSTQPLSSSTIVSSSTTTVSSASSRSTITSTSTSLATASYVVLSGDTGYGIAQKLGCTFADLARANPSVDWEKLLPAQILNVPVASGFTGVLPTTSVTNSAIITASSSSLKFSSSSVTTTQSEHKMCFAYTVAAGDYGYKIAQSFGIDFSDLKNVNQGLDWDKLLVGQVLSVPANPPKTPDNGVFSIDCDRRTLSSLNNENVATASQSVFSVSANQTLATIHQVTASPTTSCTKSAQEYVATFVSPSATSLGMTSRTSTSRFASSSYTQTSSRLICNRDNCLNNMLDNRYASQVHKICPSLLASCSTATPFVPIPTFLNGCQRKLERVRSACACIVAQLSATATQDSSSTTSTTTAQVVGNGASSGGRIRRNVRRAEWN